MENFFDQNEAKAFVYLLSEGDSSNKAVVSEDMIMIIRKGQKNIYLLRDIKKLEIENKKLLLPLIAGGIISPLAILSYFVNIFQPLLHLVSLLLGLLLFYVGWAGKSSFTLKQRMGNDLNFYLPSISKNLLAFVNYVNALIKYPSEYDGRTFLFFELRKDPIHIIKNSISEDLNLFPLLGYTFDQYQTQVDKSSNTHVIVIDPMTAGIEIKIIFDSETNQMRPRLDGPILAESIIDRFKV